MCVGLMRLRSWRGGKNGEKREENPTYNRLYHWNNRGAGSFDWLNSITTKIKKMEIPINVLEWLSDAIIGIVIIFVLFNALNTNCFQPLDWGLTAISLSFSMAVRIISNMAR